MFVRVLALYSTSQYHHGKIQYTVYETMRYEYDATEYCDFQLEVHVFSLFPKQLVIPYL